MFNTIVIESCLVVLLFETARVLRHDLFHPPEKGQTAHFPARVSPFHHVLVMVDRSEMGAQRFYVLAGNGEQFYTRAHVFVLRVKRLGPERRKVFMVEKVLDHTAAGSYKTSNDSYPSTYTVRIMT